jgi:archaellum component FlaC
MIDFTKVPNIHYWTQRVLPCVFDESLSYVEKINKLEEEINNLIEDYNTFGQAVTNEINTFEGETTNQINAFVTQVTDDINSFKENVTNNINSFETDIRNIVEEFETAINNDIATFKQTITAQQEKFETRVNNDINAMQEVVNEIPNTVTTKVNAITQPWLVANVPAMVESIVANNVNKFFDVDQLYNSGTNETIGDINNWTDTGIYFGTTNSEFLNFPVSVGAGYNFMCIVGHSADTSVNSPLQQNLYISNGNIYYRSQSDIQAWDNWYKSNISVTNIPYNTTIDFNTYFYTSTEVANGDMWIGTFQSYDKWLNAPSGFKVGDIALITNDILYAGGTIINVERVTKIGNTAPNSQYIGKTWSRCKVGPTWLSWNPTTLDYQYKEILTNTQLNDLTETGIYTISSESGVTIGGLPSVVLQYGSFYIRVTANNIGTNSDEIIQEIINTGPGANIYSRKKNGSSWSVWRAIAPNVLYEETTNFTLSGANPSYENYYPTTISTIGLPNENIFDGFEVQAIVNIDGKSSNPTPMLYNANLVYNANSPNVITIGFKVFDYESQVGKFYVKFRVLDWR